MQNTLVSSTTMRNFEILNSPLTIKKFSRGANKQLSQKFCMPIESISQSSSLKKIGEIITFIKIKNISTLNAISYLCINLLIKKKLVLALDDKFIGRNENIQKIIDSQEILYTKNELIFFDLPIEKDILGIIYQSLLLEGDKNRSGKYFTPNDIVLKMITTAKVKKTSTIFDPCCGSGSLLTAFSVVDPKKIYGVDIDPIAVLICKTNLFLKYSKIDFEPQIFCFDFLNDCEFNKKFDVIITNPPWGAFKNKKNKAIKDIESNETFSLFFRKACDNLNINGQVCFLLPESFLNVKLHSDIRRFVVQNLKINHINFLTEKFSNVMTNVVCISCKNTKTLNEKIAVLNKQSKYYCKQSDFLNNANWVFDLCNDVENVLIKKIFLQKHYTLIDSKWGLGIVTGNNKEKVLQVQNVNSEPIFTGKEVGRYQLKKANKFIVYDRKNFQQLAKDELYRTDEKLVYRFISKKLVFAYDNKKSLCLNSANILIPKIQGYSIKTILGFMNSDIFQFVYCKKINELKILKGNLCFLPFPHISEEDNITIENMIDELLLEKDVDNDLQNYIYNIFNLEEEEKKYIRGVIHG